MMAKQVITNKFGTTFERNKETAQYKTMLWARFNDEKYETLKKIAKEKGMSTSTLIRTILEEYIEKEA